MSSAIAPHVVADGSNLYSYCAIDISENLRDRELYDAHHDTG